MKMVNWLQGKKMYLAAIGLAVAAIVFFFLNQMDAQTLLLSLFASASVAGLSAKLNRYLGDAVTVLQDIKNKDLKGAINVAVTDATGVSAPPPSIPSSATAPLKLLIFISIGIALASFGTVSTYAAQKPDFTEFRGTQQSPMCSVKVSGRWEFYKCGAATDAQRNREARSTVYVDGYVPSHRVSDRSWFAVNALNFGLAAVDVEMTQRCIRLRECKEGNVLLGQSRGQEYAVAMGEAFLAAWASHNRKKAQDANKDLNIAPAAGPMFWNRFHWATAPAGQAVMHVIQVGITAVKTR